MRGMATVQMLRNIEKGTGRRIHEIFDLICGTSTGGMLAVALGIKRMDLDQCENIYKSLGKQCRFNCLLIYFWELSIFSSFFIFLSTDSC